MAIDRDVIWWTTLTPQGVGTLALRSAGDEVLGAAWGPGAEWMLSRVPTLCGADDDPAAFDPGSNGLLREAHRRNPGLRLVGSGAVVDAVIGSVLEQKVTGLQAFGAWRHLVRRHGTVAPGPVPRPMFAGPSADLWRAMPSWELHRAGVEPQQSRTIVTFARGAVATAARLAGASTGEERDRVLTAVPGIGAWTAAEVRIRAFGDPDAVSVGDYHLAGHVGHALAGAKTDDAGMLELLEPWRGQRQRVIRLIHAAGAGAPRRGPRLHPQDHRRH